MKKHKILGATLLMASLLAVSAGTFASTSADFSHVETPVKEVARYAGENLDGIGNTETFEELPSKNMAISINKSQVTSNSQSYQVEFSSKVDTFTSRYQYCYVNILEAPAPEEMKALKENDYEKDEDMPRFEGAVFLIQNISTEKNKTDVVIPSTLRYANAFFIDVTTILGSVIETNAEDITSITIPSTIKTIADGAFDGISSDCKINIEEATIPDQYVGLKNLSAQVKKGYTIPAKDKMQLNAAIYGGTFPFGSGKNYIAGYRDPDNENIRYPLTVRYDVTKSDGTVEQRYIQPEIVSQTSNFDGIGSNVGAISLSRHIDIPLNHGEEVNDDSIIFFNIYGVSRVDGKYRPDTSVMYWAKGRKGFALKEHIDDYLEYSFSGMSKFIGYTTLSMNVKFFDKNYKILKANAYNQNKTAIESGEIYIRYRFTELQSTVYCFEYESTVDGTIKYIETKIETPVPQFVCPSEGLATFMFKDSEIAEDFTAKNIKSFSIKGLTISLDLFKNGGGKAATRSNLSSRYAVVPVILNNNSVVISDTVTDVDAIFTWIAVGVSLGYIAIAIGYFFYAKEKYKNDEFKRVKPKKFIKNALYGFAGLLLTVFTVMFIVARTTWLSNSLVVFNPIDAFIIVFTIIDLIVIGYGIKVLVNFIKANKEQKRNEKLKINEDVADDGTN